jgi:iduronate 2-sulfatase
MGRQLHGSGRTLAKNRAIIWKCALCLFIPFVAIGKNNKNVLFIAIDDLRPTLGCYGDTIAITPNIDACAKKGVLYKNAYCQQALSGPSRASLLTGMYPDRIGVTDLRTHFREKCPDIITLPQFFKNNGYNAVGIGKIFHASPRTQDTVSWSAPPIYNLSDKKEEYLLLSNQTGRKAIAVEVVDMEENKFIDGKVTKEALGKIKEFGKTGESFFLAVGYIKPHLPFSMPKKYWDLYAGTDFKPLPTGKNNLSGIPEIAFHNSEELRGYTDINNGEINENKAKELLRGYYACASFIDAQIGQLMNELKAVGLDKNTIIVIWGDHGFHLGEQDLWCKSTNFEVACKVPLLIYDPECEKYSRDIDNCVESVDVYPTLLDMCGFKPLSSLPGQSLLPLMTKTGKGKDYAFSQFPRPYNAVHTSNNQTHIGYTVRIKDWRYTLWYDIKSGEITDRELYYLPDGNIEQKNLSGNNLYFNKEAELSAMIKEFRNHF